MPAVLVIVLIADGTKFVGKVGSLASSSSMISTQDRVRDFLPLSGCFPQAFLGPFLSVLLSMSELELEVGTIAVIGREIPPGVSKLLPLPGYPVSGLVMARMMTLGEEFLDSDDDIDPASMSIVLICYRCL